MSNRFYVNDEQIFGNDEFPKEVYEELKRQGFHTDDEDYFDFDSMHFDVTDPEGFLTAVEKATMRQIDKFAKKDADLFIDITDSPDDNFIISELHDKCTGKHRLLKQSWYFMNEKRFMTVQLLLIALKGFCEYDWNKDELKFKDGVKSFPVDWY